uniref:Uncharacterized protein n=1 Tax=Oryza sativa subsp. japonica TaxID=39947 RepID=Q6YPC2_ORYSJ|nr:hypothetical protein [Oryza sativa Japonica Group]BAD17835.1 hypothetical protein [Oryza sativa Japonica Group]
MAAAAQAGSGGAGGREQATATAVEQAGGDVTAWRLRVTTATATPRLERASQTPPVLLPLVYQGGGGPWRWCLPERARLQRGNARAKETAAHGHSGHPLGMPVPDGHGHGHGVSPDRLCRRGSGTGTADEVKVLVMMSVTIIHQAVEKISKLE